MLRHFVHFGWRDRIVCEFGKKVVEFAKPDPKGLQGAHIRASAIPDLMMRRARSDLAVNAVGDCSRLATSATRTPPGGPPIHGAIAIPSFVADDRTHAVRRWRRSTMSDVVISLIGIPFGLTIVFAKIGFRRAGIGPENAQWQFRDIPDHCARRA